MFKGLLLASRLVLSHATRTINSGDAPRLAMNNLGARACLSTSSCWRLHDDSSTLNQQQQQPQQRPHTTNSSPAEDTKISVTFARPDGTKVTVKSNQDKTLYDAVIDNNVDIDGFGACEGTLCCTTCHLILKEADYERLGAPSDEELDMLDLAYGLTDTSRLGCQVTLKKEFDPLEVQVPASINDVRDC